MARPKGSIGLRKKIQNEGLYHAVESIVTANTLRFNELLIQLEPKDQLKVIIDLMSFILPKATRIELKNSDLPNMIIAGFKNENESDEQAFNRIESEANK